MKKKHNPKLGPIGIILSILLLGVAAFFVINNPLSSKTTNYTSQALKISFQYPKDWYVDEKDYSILLTSYKTRIGENMQPTNNQVRLDIDRFSGCHISIEENLKDPACGEGGPSKKSQILSKETRQTPGGTFYKYLILSSNGNKFTYYLLQKGDKILQISKKPDPSQFKKEFDQIINSIEFK